MQIISPNSFFYDFVRKVGEFTQMKNYENHDPNACVKLLEECEMFHKVPPSGLSAIANLMKHRVGEIFIVM
jgi:hypothetical protein